MRIARKFGVVHSATSVGAAASDRFVQLVTYRSLRDERLPPALQALQAATLGAFPVASPLEPFLSRHWVAATRPGQRHEPPRRKRVCIDRAGELSAYVYRGKRAGSAYARSEERQLAGTDDT